MSSFRLCVNLVADRMNVRQFVINASQPASDKIFDVSAFEKFLHDRIKVEGRVGNLGDNVQISQSGDGKIEVVTHIPFSGRYLKYLYVFVRLQ
jgi:large subunit ribosomal protein L22e